MLEVATELEISDKSAHRWAEVILQSAEQLLKHVLGSLKAFESVNHATTNCLSLL